MKILFTGGGSGGHLLPIIAIARELKRLSDDKDIKLYYVGPKDPMASLLLAQENFKIQNIVTGKIRGYFSFQNIIDVLFKLPVSILQSFWLLVIDRPNLVFSKGGTGSVSVVFCAALLGIPIFAHESDMVPGSSNRLAWRWAAKKIFISFPKTEYFGSAESASGLRPKIMLVGNPILKELLEGDKNLAREIFNLTAQKPVLLFWGGSQGSQALNDFVLLILPKLLDRYQVIHVCGDKNYSNVLAESSEILNAFASLAKDYHLFEFLREVELKHALTVADFVISRSGSGSIFEIAALGKPSILVPLPSSAHNHQSKNAYEYARNGAALVIEQDNLNASFFLEKLQYLFSSPKELEVMKEAALAFAKPLAAKAIAREILEYLA